MSELGDRPYFSIILPIKGHPLLLSDALIGLLNQDFGDLEVLLSNNGADPRIKLALGVLLDDPRVRYLEQPDVLDMPTHFEVVSKMARGRYLILNTHRSVLKRHALAEVAAAHERHGSNGQIVSWRWDYFYEGSGLLLADAGADGTTEVLNSDAALIGSLTDNTKYSHVLPRSLNSSASIDVVRAMQARFGEAYGSINPDFNFAYRSLLLNPSFVHISKPLMTSQGFNISNGGRSYKGDTAAYLSTLGLTDPYKFAPIKAALVHNTIIEDFLKNAFECKRTDLVENWDRVKYYLDCITEVAEKRHAGLMDKRLVEALQAEVDRALKLEPKKVQETVAARRLAAESLHGKLRRGLRRALGEETIEFLRPFFLRFRGATRHKSVLSACGLEDVA